MEVSSRLDWHPLLSDPTASRTAKPRALGKTMVIDKGLGLNAMLDLMETAADHIDFLKIGFGTSPLYKIKLLKNKIDHAKANDIIVYPGGTFLEVAIRQNNIDAFFDMVAFLGFNGLEVSDGTIELSRELRSELIERGVDAGLTVITEYGKKCWGSSIEIGELIETVAIDCSKGASLVTIEGRESGKGVGIYDENGDCKDEEISLVLQGVADSGRLLWEAPHKDQQVHLLTLLGTQINLGNIAPQDIISLEALRRGLRSDTLKLGRTEQQVAAKQL
ncbi:phosphosulfolactate synthase [Paenibacillus thalictri]|uniref:Phosphosulfolactate synthase n=1 Tax=Paenibacillus thalictri TaxID=2527873 RepID=A0A4Q9DU63_9BACL|nr:phosphosulfolactate synthase [Paenibacillus thalictri]TBL79886.1 phosphosulfolactate synthase [Paenibacillus thalictri]